MSGHSKSQAQPDPNQNIEQQITDIMDSYIRRDMEELIDVEGAERELLALIKAQADKARQTDEHGNPIIQLNMYEAEAVAHLIKNSDPNRFNTGDWFSDVPFKIEKRLAALKKEQQ